MTKPASQNNDFNWRNGKPTMFANDKHFNGVNIEIGVKARAAKELREVLPTQSINTETETPEGRNFRLRRRAQ